MKYCFDSAKLKYLTTKKLMLEFTLLLNLLHSYDQIPWKYWYDQDRFMQNFAYYLVYLRSRLLVENNHDYDHTDLYKIIEKIINDVIQDTSGNDISPAA